MRYVGNLKLNGRIYTSLDNIVHVNCSSVKVFINGFMDTIKTKLLNIHFLVRFQPKIDPTLWKLILLLFTKSGSGGCFRGGGGQTLKASYVGAPHFLESLK